MSSKTTTYRTIAWCDDGETVCLDTAVGSDIADRMWAAVLVHSKRSRNSCEGYENESTWVVECDVIEEEDGSFTIK